MPKDPERMGASEAAREDLEDMLVGAGRSQQKLLILLRFFEEMIAIAKPFTTEANGAIRAPKSRLPIEKLTPEVRRGVNRIDGAFAETMSTVAWMQTFTEGLSRVRAKLEKTGWAESPGETMGR